MPAGGEIWNLPYEGGIVEDFVSSRAIVGNYERCGKRREVVDLAAAVSAILAQPAFTEFGQHLGVVIRTLLAGFQADVIVLGKVVPKPRSGARRRTCHKAGCESHYLLPAVWA